MNPFDIFVLSASGKPDPSIPIAAGRSGGIGVLNGETTNDPQTLKTALTRLAQNSPRPFGLKLGVQTSEMLQDFTAYLDNGLKYLMIDIGSAQLIPEKVIRGFRKHGGVVLLEITHWQERFTKFDQFDGWVVKGNEAGGLVGEENTFILLQKVAKQTALPIYARGGIGIHNSAACRVAGAAGVVLDNQMLLLRESPLAPNLAPILENLSGAETTLLGGEGYGKYFRVIDRPTFSKVRELKEATKSKENEDNLLKEWSCLVGWDSPTEKIMPAGQEIAFADTWAGRYKEMGKVLRVLRRAAFNYPDNAFESAPLSPGAPLAQLHKSLYPIVQGAMSRVSDTPNFANMVAQNGGLPSLALAMLSGRHVKKLLNETHELLGDKSWGVGLLGFIHEDLYNEQVKAVRETPPSFAYIAGGRPEQALTLEKDGIPTYLHIPALSLFSYAFDQGVRRFIFEGNECGGHIGPFSSFVLWEMMIGKFLDLHRKKVDLSDCCVLFAGGIHDARSAAMISTMASPLLPLGICIGVLMGTAYLFTKEAVETSAIKKGFQEVAINCQETTVLTTGPGHSNRCAKTEYTGAYRSIQSQLAKENLSAAEKVKKLETLNLGRLRAASKGVIRSEKTGKLQRIPKKQQLLEGMYMIGQAATLRHEPISIKDLHHTVSSGSIDFLNDFRSIPHTKTTRLSSSASDIAVVGIGAILPAAVTSRIFWENIIKKVDAITEIPPDRWDWKLYYSKDRKRRDKFYSKWGGFLEDIHFDPTQYGLPPLSLQAIDPMQLLALETVRMALEDADMLDEEPEIRDGISVILGSSGGLGEIGQQYVTRANLWQVTDHVTDEMLARLPEWTEDSFPGLLPNVAAGRIGNRFDFGGVNFNVDAACASSLAAVYLAVNELRNGISEAVIVGGVDTVQSPFSYFCFSKTQALSPTGRCHTFNEDADGIVMSEGVAMMVLKRKADAERDGDRIYAVIKGVGGSSDGRAKVLTSPRPSGQLSALRRSYKDAGFPAATLGLIEAHGTGTVVGDTSELEMVLRIMRENKALPNSCAIGSLKTMIGHTKATAGIAGLIKACLALYHKVLPPHGSVKSPLPILKHPESEVYLCADPQPWIRHPEYPRRAGVSAFGFGGANFHVALEEYALDGQEEQGRASLMDCRPVELFLWREKSKDKLITRLKQLSKALLSGARPELRDLSRALMRDLLPTGIAMAIVAKSHEDLAQKLKNALAGLDEWEKPMPSGIYCQPGTSLSPGNLAFLFPGQGSQYPHMFRELSIFFPKMLEILDESDLTLAKAVSGSPSNHSRLSQYIYPPKRFSRDAEKAAFEKLTRTDIAQPALGAVSAALFSLLDEYGIRPSMTGGHSYGEYTALYAANSLNLSELLFLSEARGRCIIEGAAGRDLGAMVAVKADRESLIRAIQDIDNIVLANHNSPDQVVLSGTKEAVAETMKILDVQNIPAILIPAGAGFHSPIVKPASQLLAKYLASVNFKAPRIPVYSNTSGDRHSDEPEMIKAEMVEHLIKSVNFVKEVEKMYSDGARIFLEVGPKSVLTGLTRKILREKPHLALSVDDNGGGLEGFLHTLGALWVHGVPVRVDRLFDGRRTKEIQLDKLLSEPSREVLPKHIWLLNGTSVKPLTGSTIPAVKKPMLTADDPKRQNIVLSDNRHEYSEISTMLEVKQMTNLNDDLDSGIGMDRDPVLLSYQETMRQFLRLQERVMMTYLGGQTELTPMPKHPSGRIEDPPNVLESNSLPVAAGMPLMDTESSQPVPIDSPLPFKKTDPQAEEPQTGKKELDSTPDINVAALLMEITCKRTGYPPDMISFEQNIEGDLGIDSIKRVEILAELQKRLPVEVQNILKDEIGEISKLKTFQDILNRLSSMVGTGGGGVQRKVKEENPQRPFNQTGEGNEEQAHAPLPRYTIQACAETVEHVDLEPLREGIYLLTQDSIGLSRILEEKLNAFPGITPILIPAEVLQSEKATIEWLSNQPKNGRIRGVIHLLPFGRDPLSTKIHLSEIKKRVFLELKSLFLILRQTGDELKSDGRVLAVSSMGGYFGRNYLAGQENPDGFPAGAGSVGLLKSLVFEWGNEIKTNFLGKAVDLDPNQIPEKLAEHLLNELRLPGGRSEVGYPRGVRTVFKTVPSSLLPKCTPEKEVDSNWVILATGGARGITSEVLRGLLPMRPSFVLVGLTDLPDPESIETKHLNSDNDLRNHFIATSKKRGENVKPVHIERQVKAVKCNRELLANIKDFVEAGVKVDYRSVDMCNETRVAALLSDIYDTYGRLDAVIHGAGILEDRLLVDKSLDSFNRVLDTKVDSAFLLSRYLRPETLKFLCFFTSTAGRFGNRGQTDYSAANEIVNRLAWILQGRWGKKVKVKAINWGPWESPTHGSGMVTPETKRQFESKGIALVPPSGGRQFFLNELRYGPITDVEVVAGHGNWEHAEASFNPLPVNKKKGLMIQTQFPFLNGAILHPFEKDTAVFTKQIDLISDPYLDQHRVDGLPVMPTACALEYAAEAIAALQPTGNVTEIRDFQLRQGLILKKHKLPIHVEVSRIKDEENVHKVAIKANQEQKRVNYETFVMREEDVPIPPIYDFPESLPPFSRNVQAVYEEWLFHGPVFQTIKKITGADEKGLTAELTPGPNSVFFPAAHGAQWLFDPALVDGLLQLVLIWSRLIRNTTCLPTRIGRLQRLGKLPLPNRLRAHLQILSEPDDPIILYNIALVDNSNRMRIRVENAIGVATADLNRLGGGWSGGVIKRETQNCAKTR